MLERAMTLEPLLDAPGVVQLHAVCALAALVIGSVQLIGPKGTAMHRATGYAWVGLMLVIATSSFWIQELNQWHGFGFIHLLSILTLITVPLAVLAARRGAIARHRSAMIVLFWSALVLAGLFTLAPGRVMHRMVFG